MPGCATVSPIFLPYARQTPVLRTPARRLPTEALSSMPHGTRTQQHALHRKRAACRQPTHARMRASAFHALLIMVWATRREAERGERHPSQWSQGQTRQPMNLLCRAPGSLFWWPSTPLPSQADERVPTFPFLRSRWLAGWLVLRPSSFVLACHAHAHAARPLPPPGRSPACLHTTLCCLAWHGLHD